MNKVNNRRTTERNVKRKKFPYGRESAGVEISNREERKACLKALIKAKAYRPNWEEVAESLVEKLDL